MSRFTILNFLLNLQGNDLIEKSIKDLREKLQVNCELRGYNVKEVTQLLSDERRRVKKVRYSKQERRRNDHKSRLDELDIESLRDSRIQLRNEKIKLTKEIRFYKHAIYEEPKQIDFFDPMELIFSQETLRILN